MNKRIRTIGVLALMTVLLTMAVAPPSGDADLLADVDTETAQLYGELSASVQNVMVLVWDGLQSEGVPAETRAGHMANYVRDAHELEYGEDGKQVGETTQLNSCQKFYGTSIYYQHTHAYTSSLCEMDYLGVELEFSYFGYDHDMCEDCIITYASLALPQEHGYASAAGSHVWGYPTGGGSSFDAETV